MLKTVDVVKIDNTGHIDEDYVCGNCGSGFLGWDEVDCCPVCGAKNIVKD